MLRMPESKLSFTCVFTTATASAWLHWVWKFCSKTAHKPEKTVWKTKNLSTWTINNIINLLQVFYGHLVQCDNKNRTYCLFKPLEFVLPFKIWANYSLRQHFFCQEAAAANHDTQAPPLCRCLWSALTSLSISWWWCHDPKVTQQHLNWNRTREKHC